MADRFLVDDGLTANLAFINLQVRANLEDDAVAGRDLAIFELDLVTHAQLVNRNRRLDAIANHNSLLLSRGLFLLFVFAVGGVDLTLARANAPTPKHESGNDSHHSHRDPLDVPEVVPVEELVSARHSCDDSDKEDVE